MKKTYLLLGLQFLFLTLMAQEPVSFAQTSVIKI